MVIYANLEPQSVVNPQKCFVKSDDGTSLVAQWLRICLPMQGTRVRALVCEDPTCRGATKPMHHNEEYPGDFPGGAVVKNPPANAGDMGSSPGPGRSHMPRSN
ncbi:hypothetical protein J1605_005695 [Eschrichtius robustus]|uniref:Uncharacterized protein n=1 Tax=Eschrichtius robustus TaxID=9764 RepID=A0AB34H7C3_ESCRO|nr:hypothetical protein J1605_005695 [Eschrichtius robustus]